MCVNMFLCMYTYICAFSLALSSVCLFCPSFAWFCFILFYYYLLDACLVSSERWLDSDRREGGVNLSLGEGNYEQNILYRK